METRIAVADAVRAEALRVAPRGGSIRGALPTTAAPRVARGPPLPLIGFGSALAVGATAAAQGAYFATAWGWCLLGFLWAAAIALIVRHGVWLSTLELWFVAGAVGFVAWTGLSIAWSASVPASVNGLERGLIYPAALLAALAWTRRRSVPLFLAGVIGGIVAVSLYALLTRLFPESVGTFDSTKVYRLADPVGYWNGLGLLAGIGTLLSIGAAGRATSLLGRGLAGAVVVPLLVTQYFTFSRGAWLALAVGFIAAAALDSRRAQLITTLLTLAPPAGLALWLASRSHALTDRGSLLAASSQQGHRLALYAVALAVLAAGLTVGRTLLERRVRIPARVALAYRFAILFMVLGVAGGVFATQGGPWTIATKAYNSFKNPPTGDTNLNSRLASLSSNGRIDLWHAAWTDTKAHPVLGSGAGTYGQWWDRHRPNRQTVRDAHNLYLQTLAELGPIGLAVLLLALMMPLIAAVRARREPLAAGALAGYVAYLVHTGVDWDWQLPGVTVAGLFCGVALLVLARGRKRTLELGSRQRLAIVACAFVAGAFSIAGLLGQTAAARSASALDAGNYRQAESQARRALRFEPWSPEPWHLLATAEGEQGHAATAVVDYRRAIAKDPGDWQLWLGLGSVSSGRDAKTAYAQARALNPHHGEVAR